MVDAYDPPQPGEERWIRWRRRTADALAVPRVSNDLEQGEAGRCDAEAAEERRLAAEGGTTGKRRSARRKAALVAVLPALQILYLTTDGDDSTVATGTPRTGGTTLTVDVPVTLRSVSGLIYLLSGYFRGTSPRYMLFRPGGSDIPILAVMSERPANTFVHTSFDERPHYVPGSSEGRLKDTGGRSTQVLPLVRQLLNLQETTSERATTHTEEVVK
ncbi:hypothetical protein KZ813_06965 [Sphingomonas sp. RHCKR7]|uniref:hypothetical protein n=1 Tax=Sphingomonas folli TaxID=2862497 RepID=UPI001CA57153|nr:hypothetical protein [Sphingomonas folli]MBW6526577.1 hypothetical protein [Sphingomonas folli]